MKTPVTPYGQWQYPGQKTIIPASDITMDNVPYPVFGIDDFGHGQIMLPGQSYRYPGQRVTEVPIMKKSTASVKTNTSYFAQDGAEVAGGYPQYLAGTQELIRKGKLVPAAGIQQNIPVMQHNKGRYYGAQQFDMQDFQVRQKDLLARIPAFNPSDPGNVRQFQQDYNNAYRNAVGTDYFTGTGPRSIDGKFGQYTWAAPAIPETITQQTPKRGVRFEKLKDTIGHEYYSPIPVGNYSPYEWREIVNQLPDQWADGTRVMKGDPYFEMFSGPNTHHTDDWHTVEGNMPFSQLGTPPVKTSNQGSLPQQAERPAAYAAPVSYTSKSGMRVSYDDPKMQQGGQNGAPITDPFAPGSGNMMTIDITSEQQQMNQNMYNLDHQTPAPPGQSGNPFQQTQQPAPSQAQQKSPFSGGNQMSQLRAGMELFGDYLEKKQQKKDDRERNMQNGFAMNAFGIQQSTNPYGAYAANVGPGATFQPNQYNTGHFKEGGEYTLTPEEIEELRRQGYEFDILGE